jgi:hypothetical protein
LETFRAYQQEKSAVLQGNLEFKLQVYKLEEERFREKIALARLLGVNLADLYKAIFYEIDGIYEDVLVSAGAPDLLVWFPSRDAGFWFLSEVKAPGDYLRESQKLWINQNWSIVCGHYLVTMLG